MLKSKKEVITVMIGKTSEVIEGLEGIITSLTSQFAQAKSANDGEKKNAVVVKIKLLQLSVNSSEVLRTALLQENFSESFGVSLNLLEAILPLSGVSLANDTMQLLADIKVSYKDAFCN